ncbi:DUF2750 domain-containing protein [Litoribrevibacter euphylliae]|uniref:DUF2750 domain-containing protein n=1 Tax=Litoribrevibacter euphylliae TaxID=1834034 RepID=A0ABV7HD67_9GAMM
MSAIQDQDAALANAETFLSESVENKQVWALKHDEGGWASCESKDYEDTAIFLFWSTEDNAVQYGQGEWKDFKPTAIDLEAFIETWLKGLDQEDHMIGMNWEAGLFGLEVEPLEIAKKLRSGDI